MQHFLPTRRTIFGLALVACVAACGGGGGGGGGSAPPIGSILSPTWSLNTANPGQLGLTASEVNAILDTAFQDSALQGALLLKRGYVVGERYASGFTSGDYGTSWSVAKSFYAAAVGAALAEGAFSSLDQPASDFLNEWLGTNKAGITLRQILAMQAGYPANDQIFFENDQTSYALDLPLSTNPGAGFVYSNPTSQLLEPLLLRATGQSAHGYLSQAILTPIGIDANAAGLWFDRTGVNPMTYCCIDLVIRDFARFGLLFARGGEWDGDQILASAFVDASLTAQSSFYGYHWWVLNQSFFGGAVPAVFAAARGLDGQYVYVHPAGDVVLVLLTRYSHFRNQGYVLSDTNYPDTCTARNSCPGTSGNPVPAFNELTLITRLAEII